MRFHTSLPVKSIPETVAFYRLLFGAEPVKTKSDYAKFLPPDLDLNISFHESPAEVGALTQLHLGLEMPDRAAMDRAHARLAEEGLVTAERETSVCCYANQDKLWVTDPNGYRWEVYLLVEDTEEKMSATTGCCVPDATGAAAGGCG